MVLASGIYSQGLTADSHHQGTVQEALALYHEEGETYEIRALINKKGPRWKWFTSSQAGAEWIASLPASATGIYFIPNMIDPATPERKAADESTGDDDVLRRRWILIDVDPVKPKAFSGQSATDAEKEAAQAIAMDVLATCTAIGFTCPVVADSGNGVHITFPIDLPNNDTVHGQIKALLTGLAKRHDNEAAKVDTTVNNAARIWKLPYTAAKKGTPTEDRPHRMAGFHSGFPLPSRQAINEARHVNRDVLAECTMAAIEPLKEPKREYQGDSLIQRFNEEHDLEALMTEAGWVFVRQAIGGDRYFRRPGKEDGNSASLRPDGKTVWIYTNSTGHPVNKTGDALEFHAHEHHGGDKSKALSEFRKAVNATAETYEIILPSTAISTPTARNKWPSSILGTEAIHGPIGQYVTEVAPLTEADPAAILMQALVMFGNRLGRSVKYYVGSSIHHANEFLLVVGSTSRGKKGMSRDMAEVLFHNTAPVSEIVMESDDGIEATGCLSDPLICYSRKGLSTGQGLIHAVRDATPARGDKPADLGIKDKRLLLIEPEFQRVLAQVRKQDSTLSSTLRDFFDSGNAALMNKVEPIKATNAHVSLIAHISPEELKAQTIATDYQNGFLNRFWICMARRSQFIPMPVTISAEMFTHIRDQLRNALRSAQITPRPLTMDDQAKEYFHAIYETELEKERHGLTESLLARAAPHVCRMAIIYAKADNATQIRLPHLRAAHALWKYSEKSAEYLFGRSTGNKHADKILALLEEAPEGMTATQIYEATGKNLNEKVRADAMEVLERQGMVIRQQATPHGRTVDLWTAT
jgi:hypothetical protein